MDRGNRKIKRGGVVRARYLTSGAILVLALSACSPKGAITTAVSAVGGAASTVVSTVGGAVGGAAKTATSATTGRSSSRNIQTGGAANSSGASLPPELIAGTAAAASTSNTGERTDAQNEAIGAQVGKKIIAGVLFCTNIDTVEYRIDCFSDQLDQVAEDVPNDADFGDARSIIANAATKLAGVAQKRASRELRPVTLSSSNVAGTGSTRPVLAVKTAELPAALAEAQVILEEAETLLLRSSETSLRRQLAYAEMSEAIGSTKILLRSI